MKEKGKKNIIDINNKKKESKKYSKKKFYKINKNQLINNIKKIKLEKKYFNKKNDKIKSNKTKGLTINKVKELMKYTEGELNDLSYKEAILYDKRTYMQYYISLLRTKHNLVFSFCKTDDFNSRIIKMNLFFVSFAIYVNVNALFFDKNKLRNIYINKGKFDFIYDLPIILYSSLISIVLDVTLKQLSLPNDTILEFKNLKLDKNKKKIIDEKQKIKSDIKFKVIIYFIIGLIILIFCWYYISIFCEVYNNTQIYLFEDSLLSFSISLIYPFGLYLVPGFFRIPALKDRAKMDRNCLYLISKFFQLF